MATIIADNIISPQGFTSEDNYQAVKAGKSVLCRYAPSMKQGEVIPFPFTASLFSQEQREAFTSDGLTPFESLAVRSIRGALEKCTIELGKRTCLVVSSTKLNVGELKENGNADYVLHPGLSAERIAHAIGLDTTPIIVCNACISGVSALILGDRLIEQGEYDYVIVCGADLQSPFIISGFQSLKALSETACRPFDIERTGLNLGEAAATVILGNEYVKAGWHITGCSVRNDAFHVSSPLPKGEGSAQAIRTAISQEDISLLAVVNAHGTATLYNDQMEANAIVKAGLSNIPINALKGYYGHTMGAAGILETIITMHSLNDNTVIGTKGFGELGVSGNLNIIPHNMSTSKTNFLKIISGFGGCNAAIHVSRNPERRGVIRGQRQMMLAHSIVLTPQSAIVDGERLATEGAGKELLTYLYKTRIQDYPKFYKMDMLARLGLVASELLLQEERNEEHKPKENRAVIFFNTSSSLYADKAFLATTQDKENYYPSPSAFVYTLPNIVNGEVAIRNNIHGETAFYILPRKDEGLMDMITRATLLDGACESIICGWLECTDENDFYAEVKILRTEN